MANREIQRAWEKVIQNGATREQWKYKLALWRLKKEQADQDQASAKTGPPKRAGQICLAPDYVLLRLKPVTAPVVEDRCTMPCRKKSEPTQNSKSKCTTPYASNIPSGSSQTATALPAISTRGDSPNCLPYLPKEPPTIRSTTARHV
jgi:hypothetical protein